MQHHGIDGTRGGRPAGRGTVLVVEDDDDTRAALADALSDLGHAIEAHADGASALERLAAAQFDVVLTDVRMPGMDGLELCRRLSGERPSVPVLVMTAFGDTDSALGALRAGASDFLTKPLSLERLADALERVLRQAPKSLFVVRPALEPAARGAARAEEQGDTRALEDVERRHILHVLDALAWNKAEAARVLGINRATLYRKLQRYGLEGD
jgi:two-component system response regulator AtoC